MINTLLKLNYDELMQICKQFHAEGEEYTKLYTQTHQRLDALHSGWQGDAAIAFFKEMDDNILPATQRLSSALFSAESVLQKIMQIIHDADEETASYFKSLAADIAALRETTQGISSGFTFPKWAEDAIKWIKDGGELLKDSLIVAALKNGSTFEGQVKIFGPNWYSKYVLGLSENLRSIRGDNLLEKLGDSRLFTTFKFVTDVIPDFFKYHDLPHWTAAVGADALIAWATTEASEAGMAGGAAIGTAICPGVGTVAGGLIGGFLAGWTTDHVLTTPLSSVIPEIGAFTGGVAGNATLPGIGWIPGAYQGYQEGQFINRLIGPDVTKSSIKDIVIDKASDVIKTEVFHQKQ